MAEVGGGGFLGAIAGIGATVGSFLKQFFGITARELVRLITALKNALVEVSQALVVGVVQLGKNVWKAVAALGKLTGLGVKRFLLWADKKFRALEGWLKARFKPVLDFLRKIKDHINDFYKRFVRPIIDTIEFIRAFNRVLQVFHINLLGRLDRVLGQIESKIDEPFLWVQRHITELQNWIDRIVTFDGVLKRVTLLRSMTLYAPEWLRIATHARSKPVEDADYERLASRVTVPTSTETVAAIEASLLGRGGRYESFVEEFGAEWRKQIEAA